LLLASNAALVHGIEQKPRQQAKRKSGGFFSVCTNSKDCLYLAKTDNKNTGTSKEWRCTGNGESMRPMQKR
jgi:hypothetical protein